jgi:hypothetical protein
MKLLYIYRLAILCIIPVCLNSCIETIEPNLDEFKPQVVIEGLVTNQNQPQVVKVKKTRSFYSQEDQEYISDALVIISDDAGNTNTLVHIEKGLYESNFVGVVGRTYTLQVSTEGKTYEASSIMNPLTKIDSLVSVYNDKESFIKKIGYYISLNAAEPQNTKDYYLWKFYRNGKLENGPEDIIIIDDEMLADNLNGLEAPYVFELGDTVRVEMFSLTEPAYKFYNSLNNNLNNEGGFFSSPPANPPSNINNGALGLFQVSTLEESEVVIK